MRIFIAMPIIFLAQTVFAQSSLMGLESGRYEVRKTGASSTKSRSPASLTANKNSKTSKSVKRKTSSESGAPSKTKVQAEVTDEDVIAKPIARVEKADNSNNEKKLNRLEFWLQPSFASLESSSNYTPREFTTNLNMLDLGGRVWTSDRVAFEGQFSSSLGGAIADDRTTRSNVSANFEEVKLGMIGRHFYPEHSGESKVDFKLQYLDSSLKVNSDAVSKRGFKSAGLGLGAKLQMPDAEKSNYHLSLDLYPRLSHIESGGNNTLGSGSSPTTSRLEFEVGKEYHLSSRAIVDLSLEVKYEKNSFEGAAASADPVTGVTPTNVNVEFRGFIFKLGYRWGR